MHDRARTQATARFLRQHVDAQGLLVPSTAFLDDTSRWNLVVYMDRIDAGLAFGTPGFPRHLLLESVGAG